MLAVHHYPELAAMLRKASEAKDAAEVRDADERLRLNR
jgi:hypothetical protein